MNCPKCGTKLPDASIERYLAAKHGRVTSEAKAKAARENGKRGGRPAKARPETDPPVSADTESSR